MRFTTKSGAVYDLVKIQGDEDGYVLARDCEVPIIDRFTYSAMDEIVGQRVTVEAMPVVGESFRYFLPSHGRVTSTPVVSIDRTIEV